MSTAPARQSRQSKRFHAARNQTSRESSFHSSQFKSSQFRTTQAHGWVDEKGDDRPSEFRPDGFVHSVSAVTRPAVRRRSKNVTGVWLAAILALALGGWMIVQLAPMLRH